MWVKGPPSKREGKKRGRDYVGGKKKKGKSKVSNPRRGKKPRAFCAGGCGKSPITRQKRDGKRGTEKLFARKRKRGGKRHAGLYKHWGGEEPHVGEVGKSSAKNGKPLEGHRKKRKGSFVWPPRGGKVYLGKRRSWP